MDIEMALLEEPSKEEHGESPLIENKGTRGISSQYKVQHKIPHIFSTIYFGACALVYYSVWIAVLMLLCTVMTFICSKFYKTLMLNLVIEDQFQEVKSYRNF